MSSYLSTTDQFPLGQGAPAESFDAFATAQQFPPERERNRIQQFDQWWRWSQRSYVGLSDSDAQPGQRRFDVTGRRQTQRLAPNLFRFIMEFWGDAVAVDAPVVRYGEKGDAGAPEGNQQVATSRQQQFIDRLMPALMRASRLAVADIIRYGCGVIWSRHALRPEALDPRFWYPIRPAHDPYEMLGEVVATPWASKPNGTVDRVTVYLYPEDGTAGVRTFALEGMTLGRTIEGERSLEVEGNGMVVPVRGREGIYGTSDFLDAAEYVAELHRRETAISEALDEHAYPHLAVPEGVLEPKADGSVTLQKKGMVIPVPEGARFPPQYVVWDADFQAQQEGITRAEQRILRLSSIAPILATPGDAAGTLRGGLPSGTALRRLAVISVNRLKAIREELTAAWLRVIPAQALLLAAQGGEAITIDADQISIEWPPEFSTVDDDIEAGAGLPGGDQDAETSPPTEGLS